MNGASFHPGGAPLAIMTAFGTALSDAVYQSTSYPLPTQLGPTRVTVDGIPAPLYYVSPTQINFQMPSLVSGNVTVVVNNNAPTGLEAVAASPSYVTAIGPINPGMFETTGHRAAALNGNLTPHTAATPIGPGEYGILFATGQGAVSPPVTDGPPATAAPLSIVNAPLQVNIGGRAAQVTYQRLAPGYAGLTQLNVIVPDGLAPGNQAVFVTINGVTSNSGLITVK